MGRKEDRLLVQPGAVVREIGDALEPRVVGHRAEVDETEDPGGEGIREQRLEGRPAWRIAHEGRDRRVGSAYTGVVLRDAQDDDEDTTEEEQRRAEAGRAEGEPGPEPCSN